MGVVKAREQDIDLLARLLRAEAEGEGETGMLLVGNVGINRIRANCSDFKGIRTIPQMVYQEHAFEAVIHGYFYQKARDRERRLALEIRKRGTAMAGQVQFVVLPPGRRLPAYMVQPAFGRPL